MLDPTFDRRAALIAQREQLAGRTRRMEAILAAIDRALDALSKGTTMNDADMFEVFGDFDPKAYEIEVKERWGDTDAYAASARRTARYTKDDWKAIKAESEAIGTGLGAALAAGAAPGDPEVQALVERHRLQIDTRFYPCSKEMHATLGDMYVADPRFEAHLRADPARPRPVRPRHDPGQRGDAAGRRLRGRVSPARTGSPRRSRRPRRSRPR